MSRSRRLKPSHLHSFGRLVAIAGLALLLSQAAVATEPAPILHPDGIWFEIEADQAWLLTISGPNGFYTRAEIDSESPALSLAGSDGSLPADGSYVWELKRLGFSLPDRPDVRSGVFHVRNGQTLVPINVIPEEATPVPAAATSTSPLAPTHVGDVSIEGQLCVGTDCDEFVPLPIEAIRMYQNNVSLVAFDTSDEAAFDPFPANDWQLKFNDSARLSEGGANYFGIEDRGDTNSSSTVPFRLDAGAPADSIRIDQNGRVGIGTATPGATLHVAGDAVIDGDFTASSSREVKHAFTPIEPRRVLESLLELPITEWSFLSDPATVRHMGPVAEQFSAAFGLGRDNRHVSPVDLSGVAFAAIQGLADVVLQREAEIAELRASRDELAARLAAVEQLIAEGERSTP